MGNTVRNVEKESELSELAGNGRRILRSLGYPSGQFGKNHFGDLKIAAKEELGSGNRGPAAGLAAIPLV